MRKKRTPALLAELKQRSANVRAEIYECIRIAATVLKDADWIATVHDGDDAKAAQALEDEYFSLVAKVYSLPRLVAIYYAFPSRDEWESVRFDLHAMNEMYEERRREERADAADEDDKPKRKTVKVAEFEQLQKQHAETVQECKHQAELIDRIRKENSDLRVENDRLKTALSRAEGRIEELERIVKREFAGV